MQCRIDPKFVALAIMSNLCIGCWVAPPDVAAHAIQHVFRLVTSQALKSCRKGLRTATSIVAETAQCFSTHQVAVLIGYGAHAICPYLALETCRQWRMSNRYATAT